ncbi:MAG: hypothetical protein Q8P24_13885, partial [Desulfobacterales bacterium]|nr:hypothetical protein [Desulfobacterales bacterium]
PGTKGRELIGHGGWYPGYQTAAYISPKEKLGVIVFANSLDANPYPGTPLSITDRIFSWVAPAVGKARKGRNVPEPPFAWKRLTGVYRSLWSDIHILPLEGKLMLIDPTIPDPKSAAMTLEPVSQGIFRLEGNNGYWELGEPVVFEAGDDGYASAVKVGENTFMRVAYPVQK